MIETCFEMLKSSEQMKLEHQFNYKFHNFLDCSDVRSADPPIFIVISNSKYRGPC